MFFPEWAEQASNLCKEWRWMETVGNYIRVFFTTSLLTTTTIATSTKSVFFPTDEDDSGGKYGETHFLRFLLRWKFFFPFRSFSLWVIPEEAKEVIHVWHVL